MYINKIKLKNFRNYEEQEIELNKNINIFYGDNAQGKTNIIESIYISSIGKSFRTSKDIELIKFNEEYAQIFLEYTKTDREGKIKIEIADKKSLYVNSIKIKKLSELLGNINIVLFTPDDINVLREGPQARRKFLDIMISQLRPNYIHNLNMYMKTIDQRNNYLKQIKNENKKEDMLEIWDEKLAEYGEKIYIYRNEFIEKIKEKINKIHEGITEGKEEIKIEYTSNCKEKEEYLKSLQNNRKLDIIRGYTSKGIHRDDFLTYINNKPINVYGSQGQNRTAVLTLKIAELQVIKDEIGEYPILLLDDFMSELDEKRRKNFLQNIENTQVIITCTDKMDLEKIENKLYNVNNGKIKKVIHK